MSIVSLRYRTRRTWIRWLLGLFSYALTTACLAISCATTTADDSVEPDEYLIVSDDDEIAPERSSVGEESEQSSEDASKENSESKGEPTADLPDEEVTGDKRNSSDADPDEEDSDKKVAKKQTPDKKRVDEADTDEGSEDEVAPIRETATKGTTPIDEADERQSQAHVSDSDSPVTESGKTSSTKTPPSQRPAVEGASFKGVLPGVTTVDELEKDWGSASEVRKTPGGMQHIYEIKPFKQVVATVVEGKVDTVIMHLEKLFEARVLARQLKLDDVEPATIFNAKGQMLGMTFPERGVLFGFAPGTPVRIAQIVLEPINSQPFITRAEKNCQSHPTDALVDVEYALQIDPDYDRGHAVKARVLVELGQYNKALAAAERALDLTPQESEFRIARAKILLLMHDFAAASSAAKKIADEKEISTSIRAQAQMILGDTLARGEKHAFDEAIKLHTEAIKLAEQASTESAGPLRRAAKQLLMDAHLAIAHDIAWGNWQQKPKVVPEWIDRANGFCDNLIKNDQGSERLRLRIYHQSLHAYAGMKGAPDVSRTIDAMTVLGRKLIADESTTSRRQLLNWQLGDAMASAMAIVQNQSKSDAATQFGQQALAYFEQSGPLGETWPGRDQIVGKVYYRLGAIQAIDKSDHKNAIVWYEKAAPLLESPAPPFAAAENGRLGEMFVSMAVSYWESGQREEAVRLTQQGAKLMETAVEEHWMAKDALLVPYGNLSSMHAELGHAAESKQFAEMAAKLNTVRR